MEEIKNSNALSLPIAKSIVCEYGFNIVIRRWMATVIDLLVLGSIVVLYILSSGLFAKQVLNGSVYSDIYKNIDLVIWLFSFSLLLLYYPVLEGFTGYTIGKFILRIRVINDNSKNPGVLKSIIRTLFRLIEVNPLLLGGIPAGIIVAASKMKQRIGDMVANTYVVLSKDVYVESGSKVKKIVPIIICILILVVLLVDIFLLVSLP